MSKSHKLDVRFEAAQQPCLTSCSFSALRLHKQRQPQRLPGVQQASQESANRGGEASSSSAQAAADVPQTADVQLLQGTQQRRSKETKSKYQRRIKTSATKPQARAPPNDSQRRWNGEFVAAKSAHAVLDVYSRMQDPQDLTPVNAATAFHRLAKHAVRLPEEERSRLRADARVARLAAATEACWESWGGYAVANIAWAQQALGHGCPTLTTKVWHRLLAKLPGMEVQEVSAALMALTKLGALPGSRLGKLRAPLSEWLTAAEDPMPERNLNGIVWAYAKQGVNDPAVVPILAAKAKITLQSTKLHCRGLASMAWAFAKLGHRDEALFDLLAAQVVATLARARSFKAAGCSAFDLANFAWAFAKAYGTAAGERPDYTRDDAWISEFMARAPVRQQVFKLIAARGGSAVPSLSCRGVSSMLWGLATARFYEPAFTALLCAKIEQDCDAYNLRGIAICFWALATLRYDAPATMEAMASAALRQLDRPSAGMELQEQSLNMIVIACAHIDCAGLPRCRELVRRLAGLVAETRTEILRTSQGLANVAWGLACAQALDRSLLGQICVRLTKIDGPLERELSQIHHAQVAMRLVGGAAADDYASATDISEFLEECFQLGRLKMAASQQWRRLMMKSVRSVTDLHWDVATVLQSLGAHFRIEMEAEDYSIDIAIEDQRIAIEVDGPVHFTRNTHRPLGFHVMKQRLLQLRGWRVINVPFFTWNGLNGADAKRAYLLVALEAAGWERQADGSAALDPGPAPAGAEDAAACRQPVSDSTEEGGASDGEDGNMASGFAALSRADRLALVLPSRASKRELLLERAKRRTK